MKKRYSICHKKDMEYFCVKAISVYPKSVFKNNKNNSMQKQEIRIKWGAESVRIKATG